MQWYIAILPFKNFWTVRFWMFFKEFSPAHQVCIFLSKIQQKQYIVKYFYYLNNCFLFEYQKSELVIKTCSVNFSFTLHKTLIYGLQSCGILLIIVMNNCLNSNYDGTHLLQRIHWWANNAMIHLSKPVLIKKQTALHLGWPERE